MEWRKLALYSVREFIDLTVSTVNTGSAADDEEMESETWRTTHRLLAMEKHRELGMSDNYCDMLVYRRPTTRSPMRASATFPISVFQK